MNTNSRLTKVRSQRLKKLKRARVVNGRRYPKIGKGEGLKRIRTIGT